MRKPHVLFVLFALAALPSTARADSPLTSTDLDRAYADVADVTRARRLLLDQQTFTKLRAPASRRCT